MASEEFQMFAVSAPGLEEICAGELHRLGMAGVRAVAGGVEFAGDRRDLYRANLMLRSASRVLVRVGSFGSRDFPDLFKKNVRLPWGRFIRPQTPVEVRAASRGSRLQHTGRIAATVAEAVDRALGRRPEETAGGERQLLVVRLEHDFCQVSVDSSGALLHRRGYREEGALAPLRETLAAGILLLLGWDGSVPLVDPMCGSGTLVLEAALLAAGRAPGGGREFAFSHWPHHRPGLWQALLDEARREERAPSVLLAGRDREADAVEAARRNAGRAGIAPWVDLQRAELADLPPWPGPPGLVVSNPPYGHRLGANAGLGDFYKNLGRQWQRVFPGWQGAFLAPDPALARATGLEPVQVASLVNGGIAVGLYAVRP